MNLIARGLNFLAAAGYTSNTVTYSTSKHSIICSVKDSRKWSTVPNSNYLKSYSVEDRDVYVQKNDLRASYQFSEFDGFDAAIIRTWNIVIALLHSRLQDNKTIVFDIGANYGAYSLGVDALGIKLALVEPNPMISICLEKTYPNAYVLPKALVAENSQLARMELNMSPLASGGSTLCKMRDNASTENLAFSIYCDTLKPSELFSICNDANCAFIKLDMEGYEPELFRSGFMGQVSFRYPNFVMMVEYFKPILSLDDQNLLLETIGDYPCLVLSQPLQAYDAKLLNELRRPSTNSLNYQSIYRYFRNNLSTSRSQLEANVSLTDYADIIVFSSKSLLELIC